jgi:hypothetical protein
MSTNYLVSQYNGKISDVVTSTVLATFPITGNYVLRVPDDVAAQGSNVASLTTSKYTGLLGNNSLFTQVVWDDMFDASGVDTGNSTGVTLGKNGSVSLYPAHGGNIPILQTTIAGISWPGPGPGPSQAMVAYELFDYVDTDDKTAPYQRSYRELSTGGTDIGVEVSFNGGSNFTSVVNNSVLTIPGIVQGNQVVLKFTRLTDSAVYKRIFVGSWAVLF